MSGRPWYKRCGADFIEGTMGLSLEEKGAYSLCLDLIYSHGGPIADDARWLAGICGVSVRKWSALRQRLIDTDKLFAEGGRLGNKRASKELFISSEISRERAENGSKGGNKSAETRSIASENKDLDEAKSKLLDKSREEKKEEPNGSSRRGTRIPGDWVPDEIFARQEGLSADECQREAEKFRDYWRGVSGQRGVKADWPATWKNWVRKVTDGRAKPPSKAAKDWRLEPEYRGVL